MRKIVIVSVVLIGVLIFSCDQGNDLFGSSIAEGKIDYAVTFPHMEADNVMMSILPNQMTISFKGNKYNSEFNTYGGVFKNKISIDTEDRSYSQMLKIFKKRLACEYDQIDLDEMLQDFPPFTIIKSDNIDTVAGIPCNIAKGVFYNMDEPDIDIYYSDRIAVEDPNWCSPFSELEGFLLGYDIDMFDMRLRLIAEEVRATPVQDEEFMIEEDYKMVSYKYIKVELEKLMDSFDI